MKRLFLALVVIACILPMSGKIVVEKKDGSVVTPQSTSFNAYGNGSYKLGDIDVSDIKVVYNTIVSQPPQSGEVVLGDERVKPVAVLDMNKRNGIAENSEDGRYLYSAEYMMQIAGLPYFVATSLDEALASSSMILFSGTIGKKTFSDDEYDKMYEWVEDGGIIVSSAIEYSVEGKCFDLFGIKGLTPKQKTHTLIKWIDKPIGELAYIDCEEETNTYIGQNYIFTSAYAPQEAQVLATYDDTSDAAVIKHQIGKGCTYSNGVRWRDVIQRNQLNKSGSDRIKNNHFEASADVFPLFVRALYVENAPVAVWKHTIPNGYYSVLIPTHDCDSRTAYDEMHWMSEYEQSIGLNAHFFLTVHYFRQPNYLSAFYNEETVPAARELLARGHTVGSHSICHFPDFANTERFPMTITTPDEYAETCTYDVENAQSSGGSTWAEIVMSKQIIERDLGNKVRAFRSGHLCVNANIPEALSVGEYSFASCYTATDLRGAFPFFQRAGVKWTGEQTDVLQMPLHFSDVRPTGVNMSADEIEGTMPVWLDYHEKLKANYAPNILLIHPNAKWKMEAEKKFVEMLDKETVGVYNFEAYGDFWIKRLELDFDYGCDGDDVKIIVKADDLTQYKGQGLFVETSKPVKNIIVADNAGRKHTVRIVNVSENKYIAVL